VVLRNIFPRSNPYLFGRWSNASKTLTFLPRTKAFNLVCFFSVSLIQILPIDLRSVCFSAVLLLDLVTQSPYPIYGTPPPYSPLSQHLLQQSL